MDIAFHINLTLVKCLIIYLTLTLSLSILFIIFWSNFFEVNNYCLVIKQKDGQWSNFKKLELRHNFKHLSIWKILQVNTRGFIKGKAAKGSDYILFSSKIKTKDAKKIISN